MGGPTNAWGKTLSWHPGGNLIASLIYSLPQALAVHRLHCVAFMPVGSPPLLFLQTQLVLPITAVAATPDEVC